MNKGIIDRDTGQIKLRTASLRILLVLDKHMDLDIHLIGRGSFLFRIEE